MVEITARTQEHFPKPLSVNTVRHCIHTHTGKNYAMKKPYKNMIQDLGSFRMKWETWPVVRMK